MITIVLLLWLSVFSDAQIHRDLSFQQMCASYQGAYNGQSGGSLSQYGDTCQVTFQHGESTPEGAQQYCEDNIPFHITSSSNGPETVTCTAEATVTCDNGWDQFYGRCYRIEKRLMGFQEAEDTCKKNNSRIAFIHREAVAFLWKEYYNKVSRIWVQAGPVISENLIYDKGPNLLLAFDGHPFGLPANSFAKVDGSKVEAMVLCESDPMITRAEANYIAKRYSEIYYPVFSTEKAMMVRTSSAMPSQIQNSADKYCLGVLKAFVNTEQKYVQSAIVDREFLDEVTKDGSMAVVRTAFHNSHKDAKANREAKGCIVLPDIGTKYTMTKHGVVGEQEMTIDQTLFSNTPIDNNCGEDSVGFRIQDPVKNVELMPDTISAPMYCQLRVANLTYGACEPGYISWKRKSGMVWCHKLILEVKPLDHYRRHCQELGGHVSGFEDKAEYDFLFDHIQKTVPDPNMWFVWLGAERRKACDWGSKGKTNGFDASGECSRELVFEWLNNVAPNPPMTEGLWADVKQPDYLKKRELYLHVQRQGDNRKGLNDIHETFEGYGLCGKEAPIIES